MSKKPKLYVVKPEAALERMNDRELKQELLGLPEGPPRPSPESVLARAPNRFTAQPSYSDDGDAAFDFIEDLEQIDPRHKDAETAVLDVWRSHTLAALFSKLGWIVIRIGDCVEIYGHQDSGRLEQMIAGIHPRGFWIEGVKRKSLPAISEQFLEDFSCVMSEFFPDFQFRKSGRKRTKKIKQSKASA